MLAVLASIDAALSEAEAARKRLSHLKARQINRPDDVDYFKAVSYAWFQSHRKSVGPHAEAEVADVDSAYDRVLKATTKAAARTTYVQAFNDAKRALVTVRSVFVLKAPPPLPSSIPAPDFSPLAADPIMREILSRRWAECQKCIAAGAPLAATVMMGGLLEALFVARANRLVDKRPLFTAKTTPIDGKTKKALALTEWTLRPYIDVGYELGWISSGGKDVAAVLRDYRNYVHPEKERSHGVKIADSDARMFFDLTRHLALQLLASGAT